MCSHGVICGYAPGCADCANERQDATYVAVLARKAKFAADQALRDAVLGAVSRGASVRELSTFSNLSTNTISRWKRESK